MLITAFRVLITAFKCDIIQFRVLITAFRVLITAFKCDIIQRADHRLLHTLSTTISSL